MVIQLVLVFTGGADANSGPASGTTGVGVRLWRLFSYFTIQSNLLVLATSVVLVRRPDHDGRIWRVVRLDALLGIVVTGFGLRSRTRAEIELDGWALVATIGFHYVSPWAALALWLLFDPRSRLSWRAVGAAFVWPVLWLLYIFVQGAFTDWYPYPFLDVTDIGYGAAIRNASLVLVVGFGLAAAFKALDARLPKRSPGTPKR